MWLSGFMWLSGSMWRKVGKGKEKWWKTPKSGEELEKVVEKWGKVAKSDEKWWKVAKSG